MKFKEAMDELKLGSKVTRLAWIGKMYFKMTDGKVVCHQSSCTWYTFDQDIMTSDGWEVLGKPEEQFSFSEIIPYLMNSYEAKMSDWKDCCIYFDSHEKMLILKSMQELPYTPLLQDFVADDWMVIQ